MKPFAVTNRWTLPALLSAAVLAPAARRVLTGERGLALIPVLKQTGLAMLTWAILTAAALAWG